MAFAIMQTPCHFFMIRSLEPCDPWEIMIESPVIDDGTNPYFETPVISDLMPVIFDPGAFCVPCVAERSGDWYKVPISGDGMLSEIRTFVGYASAWTWRRDGEGVMVAERERFLGSCTFSRVGGGEWIEEIEHRRGFDEPLKRLTIKGVDGESGYYLERYVFDGQHISRNDTRPHPYLEYDYDTPPLVNDPGDYSLEAWLLDRSRSYPHMKDGCWREYRCPSFSVSVPNQIASTYPHKEEHRNIVVHCESDELWHIAGNKGYDISSEYDIYVDDVFVCRNRSPYRYTSYLYDFPDDVLSQEIQRRHYPKIGTERVRLNYRPSALPVILGGGSMPSFLVLVALVLLCAVSNNSVTSSIDSDIDEEEKRGKKDANG